MLAEGHRHMPEMLARGAVKMHVPGGAEGMRRHRAEITVFRAEFLRAQTLRPRLVAHPRLLRDMGARPGIAAIAADHGGCETRLDRHGRQRDCQDLAGAAVVERRGKASIDAEPLADALMMTI